LEVKETRLPASTSAWAFPSGRVTILGDGKPEYFLSSNDLIKLTESIISAWGTVLVNPVEANLSYIEAEINT